MRISLAIIKAKYIYIFIGLRIQMILILQPLTHFKQLGMFYSAYFIK